MVSVDIKRNSSPTQRATFTLRAMLTINPFLTSDRSAARRVHYLVGNDVPVICWAAASLSDNVDPPPRSLPTVDTGATGPNWLCVSHSPVSPARTAELTMLVVS